MCKRNWQGSDPELLLINDNNGIVRAVIDPINYRPLKVFANLPITISKKVEGWLMEAWQREDRTIRIEDIIQRMPFIANDDVWENKKFRNTLTQRKDRFRNRGRCLSWGMVCHNRKWDQRLQEDMNANPDWLKANTTRYLQDLTVKEERVLGAATLLSGKHQSKAGKNALQGQAKVDKKDKMKKLLDDFEEDGGAPILAEEVPEKSKRRTKTRVKKNNQPGESKVAQQIIATDEQTYDDTAQGQGEFVSSKFPQSEGPSAELLDASNPPAYPRPTNPLPRRTATRSYAATQAPNPHDASLGHSTSKGYPNAPYEPYTNVGPAQPTWQIGVYPFEQFDHQRTQSTPSVGNIPGLSPCANIREGSFCEERLDSGAAVDERLPSVGVDPSVDLEAELTK